MEDGRAVTDLFSMNSCKFYSPNTVQDATSFSTLASVREEAFMLLGHMLPVAHSSRLTEIPFQTVQKGFALMVLDFWFVMAASEQIAL